MQSPAVGKGMSELIRTGGYETIDLDPLDVVSIGRLEGAERGAHAAQALALRECLRRA